MLNFERTTGTFAQQHQVDWPTQKDHVDKIKSSMVKIHNAAEKCKIHYVAENDTCGMIDLLGISSSWRLAQNSHDAIWCEHNARSILANEIKSIDTLTNYSHPT